MKFHIGAAGRYKVDAVRLNPDGSEQSRRELAGWFENLITDNGLDLMTTTAGYMSYCSVGAGSTPPSTSDTSLGAQVAVSSLSQSTSDGSEITENYAWFRKTFRFLAGAAAGNLSEVGVGANPSGGNLFSRALIQDTEGNPTTITVLEDEVLDVTYELRWYYDVTDHPHSVDISGVTYSCVARLANQTEALGSMVGRYPMQVSSSSRANGASAYSGTIGPVTGGPSGTRSPMTFTNNAYVAGTFTRTARLTAGLDAANFPGGISAIQVDTSAHDTQISFDPPIPKDNTKVLTLDVTYSWGRRDDP